MALEIGDELFVYTTRGCFHNPVRDAGLVMGLANVTTHVSDLAKSVVFGERRYTSGCALAIQGVAALREGVKLSALVTELHVFPDTATWGSQLRHPLVPLDDHDASLLRRHVTALLKPLDRHIGRLPSDCQASLGVVVVIRRRVPVIGSRPGTPCHVYIYSVSAENLASTPIRFSYQAQENFNYSNFAAFRAFFVCHM